MNLQEGINLVSSYADRQGASGPSKVLENLVKGLDKIQQPFVVNRALDAMPNLWVHSDFCPLIDLPADIPSLLGPNLAVLPRDLPGHRRFTNSMYLHPCDWAVKVWEQEGFERCPLRVWPVGIDTEKFAARPAPARDAPILIYHKQRSSSDLACVQDLLVGRGIRFDTVTYGEYSEQDYIDQLRSHAFVIWLGCHESQGIALQEALAMDVPVLVVDATSLWVQETDFKARFPDRLRSIRTTSAPYFDSRCGLIADDLASVGDALTKMQSMLGTFRPRDYILDNLSLEGQAHRFVDFFYELARNREGTRGHRGEASRGERYRPGRVTQVRARVSLKSGVYAMKIRGIFR